jgi:hypothetical protein
MNTRHSRFALTVGWSAGSVCVALVAGLMAQGSRPGQVPDESESLISRGFALAPVPLAVSGKNPALVGLGSYLVNTLHCSDCHTNPPFAAGGNPFMGQPERINAERYLGGGNPFGPVIRSRDITPQAGTGLPAGYTLAQFVHVMRTGEDLKDLHPQISPLLQVMPWPWYKDLTDRELAAIYEYLRAIPGVDGET